jgi:hypothetical protein
MYNENDDIKRYPSGFDQYGNPYGFKRGIDVYYLYDGKHYTEDELIDFADTTAHYDMQDSGELIGIRNIEEAIDYLGEDEVDIVDDSKYENGGLVAVRNYDADELSEISGNKRFAVEIQDEVSGDVLDYEYFDSEREAMDFVRNYGYDGKIAVRNYDADELSEVSGNKRFAVEIQDEVSGDVLDYEYFDSEREAMDFVRNFADGGYMAKGGETYAYGGVIDKSEMSKMEQKSYIKALMKGISIKDNLDGITFSTYNENLAQNLAKSFSDIGYDTKVVSIGGGENYVVWVKKTYADGGYMANGGGTKKKKVRIEDIMVGDKVLANNGQEYYVVSDYSQNSFWVTDDKNEKNNPNATGWTLFKEDVVEILDDDDDDDDDDYADGGIMAKGGQHKVNKKYAYFAVNKKTNKIIDGWEIVDDVESLKYYAKMDLEDNDLNPKDYNLLSAKTLKARGIDPYSWDSWAKTGEYGDGGLVVDDKRLDTKEQSDEERELELYIDNDSDLYRKRKHPIEINLTKKLASGKFDINQAPKLYRYLIDDGIKKYTKDFGGIRLTKEQKDNLSKAYVNQFLEDADSGQFDEYIPKKYKHEHGGHTQGYDDREDERLAMEHGRISGKDFVGSHEQREHSRRDDAKFEERMKKGGVTFEDKVESISDSLYKRKKVSPSVQKDYGKTYSKSEAIDSAKRIAGAMRKKEMAKKKS